MELSQKKGSERRDARNLSDNEDEPPPPADSPPAAGPPRAGLRELGSLLPYLGRYGTQIGWGIVLVLIANSFSLAVPELIRRGINVLETPGDAARPVLVYAGLLVLAALLGGAARYGMRELLNGVSRRVEFDLRNDFFAHLLRLDAGFFGRTQTGDIMSRATNDIQAVRMAAGPAYMYLANTIVMAVLALILMLRISPVLTGIALLPMLALPPVTIFFGRAINQRFERVQDQFGDLSTAAQENFAGVRIVKAYGQESAEIERFRTMSETYLSRNLNLVRISGLFHPLLGLLSGLGMVVVVWLGGLAIIRGQINVGDFVAFGLYLAMLTWPLIALGWVVNLFQRGAASMGRINRILKSQPAIAEPSEPEPVPRIRGEVEFRNVWFRYPGTYRDVLRDVSFRIPAGATAAIVGATGSGKSTLVHLMTRVYDPTGGKVLLDGVPLHRLPLEQLRAAIGIVPQETFLFSESIGDNLAMGFDEPDPALREARIVAAARTAQLEEAIRGFPGGYETRLGERGINLSGGQKQRATLARAIAREPQVLILDDSLSAVDTQTEHRILDGLRGVVRTRTSIIVSHRVSAVMDADLILVMGDGEIAERGTHAELLQLGGVYAALQHRQLLAETLDEPVLAPATEGG